MAVLPTPLSDRETTFARAAGALPAPPSPKSPPQIIGAARDLGPLVKKGRKRMRLNQQKLADLTGVGRRFISELESGKPTLEFDRVVKVCGACGIVLTAATPPDLP